MIVHESAPPTPNLTFHDLAAGELFRWHGKEGLWVKGRVVEGLGVGSPCAAELHSGGVDLCPQTCRHVHRVSGEFVEEGTP